MSVAECDGAYIPSKVQDVFHFWETRQTGAKTCLKVIPWFTTILVAEFCACHPNSRGLSAL